MNLEQEFAAINRRVQAQINASAREALIRIGVDPDEVEREEAAALARLEEDRLQRARAEAARLREELLAPFVAAGALVRAFADGVAAMAEAFSRGFEGERR